MAATIAVPAENLLGEGPHWHAEEQALYWVDIIARSVYRWHPASGEQHAWTLPESVSAAIPRHGGGLVVALASGVGFLSEVGDLERWVAPDPDPGNRANEARCDAQGRLWLGTMQNNIGPNREDLPITRDSGALFRVDPDGGCSCWAKDVGISNTLVWAPDGRTLYFADTLANRIDAFDFDPATGALSNRRSFVEGGRGKPDGSAIDQEGCIWNARWGGACLLCFRPDGSVAREVPLPVLQPTSCAFGGPDLRTLYITSARVGLAEPGPADGAVLALPVEVPGLPGHSFAG